MRAEGRRHSARHPRFMLQPHHIADQLSFCLCTNHELDMMGKDREHQQRVLSGTVDLWEHACLLYHNYGWQSAAGAFSQLEQHTSDLGDKCLFALNKGLIEARLGDIDIALASFTKALEYDEGHPVTHFLLGLAHAVTQHYARAKTQFQRCLNGLGTNERDYQTHLGSFVLDKLMVQENIDHMQSRLIATAAGHGRTSHIRTRLHILPADVLFEPSSGSTRTSQRDSISSMGQRLVSKVSQYTDERLQDPISQATQPLHMAGHDVQSLHLVEDAEKNLTIAPTIDPVNDVQRQKRMAPRDPRVQDGSMQELAQFLRHAGPSGDANVTVDRKYMQRLLQGNRHDRALLHSGNPASTSLVHRGDDFESLLRLYTGASTKTRSVSTTIGSSVSDALTIRHNEGVEQTTAGGYERSPVENERPLGSRRPALIAAQRWLRKEIHSPGPYELAANGEHNIPAMAARDHSRGTVSGDDRDEQSLPSVVSSTEMFTIGRPRKGLHQNPR